VVDLTDPNPLVMTHFEFVGFVSGLLGVLYAVISDFVRRRRERS